METQVFSWNLPMRRAGHVHMWGRVLPVDGTARVKMLRQEQH